MKSLSSALIELTKPRIVIMQAVTLLMGVLAVSHRAVPDWIMMGYLIVGTLCSSAGASVLNHFFERQSDAKMQRTMTRPLPSGQLTPSLVGSMGICLVMAGLWVLWVGTRPNVMFLSFLTVFLYNLVYTPLKRWTWLNTYVGTIPGALPPLAGAVAVTGHITPEAWGLFWLIVTWQLPHFFSIDWLLKDDYARAGIKMVSGLDPSGHATWVHMMLSATALMVVSLWLMIQGPFGMIDGLTALACTLWQWVACWRFRTDRRPEVARRIMRISILILPIILVAMGIGRWIG